MLARCVGVWGLMDGQTNRPKPVYSFNFFDVGGGGIKCINVQVISLTNSIYDHFII